MLGSVKTVLGISGKGVVVGEMSISERGESGLEGGAIVIAGVEGEFRRLKWKRKS